MHPISHSSTCTKTQCTIPARMRKCVLYGTVAPVPTHRLPFVSTNCFFGGFPAFFVGGHPISFSQKPWLFPFMGTYISLHKNKLFFWWSFSLFRTGASYQFYSKTFTFALHVHIMPFINTSCFFWWFSSLFCRGPPISLNQETWLFPSWAHIALHKHKLFFWLFSSLFSRGPPISFSQTTVTFSFHGHILPFINTSCFLVIFQPFS